LKAFKETDVDGVLGIALQGMQQDLARLERISANIANAVTPGYRREFVVSQPIGSAAMPFAAQLDAQAAASGQASAGATAPAVSVVSDSRSGTLKQTGQSLDIAVAGRGFFEVSTETGPAYTRQGNFQIDARGRLVTVQGHAVMSESGEIVLKTNRPSIDASGNVTEDGKQVARLKIVAFDDERSLHRLGEGLMSGGSTTVPISDGQTSVRQGYLENSNVSTLTEMTQLIQTARHFETMQRIAQGFDEMTGTAIRRLGEA
jgi:flagellar basal-body rod protein FlgG